MKIIISILCLLICSGNLSAQQAASTGKGHRVIIQLTSSDTLAWKGIGRNIRHLKEHWGDDVQVEVVAHGAGIEYLVAAKTSQQEMISQLAGKGVIFAACENTMKDRKLTRQDLLPVVTTVPSGVVEVVSKEELGWSYLKGGM